MPLPAKLLSVPPATVMSPTAKSVDDSLSVKVRVATSPTFRALSLVVMVTVGAVVSTVKEPAVDAVAPEPLMATATV